MIEFIIAFSKIFFGINFIVVGCWITAVLWYKMARVWEKITTEKNRYR